MLSRKLRPTSHSESEGSSSTVSLSDDDWELMSCESPQPCNGPTLVSFTELETSSQNSSAESDSGEDSIAGDKSVTERDFQQHLSLLKCRFMAELEKIDDEIAAAENCYFGTRRTRVGSILKGYGDYATCNMDMLRNKKYCKPVKLSDRVFSLSSKSSRIHEEYEEECKTEELRREAQLSGFGFFAPGIDQAVYDPSYQAAAGRMGMDFYPQVGGGADMYGYQIPGQIASNGQQENMTYGGQSGFPPYLYNPQMYYGYDNRQSMSLQGRQMMGGGMRMGGGPQGFIDPTDPATSNAQAEYMLSSNTSMKRQVGEDDIAVGNSFNVDQFLNAAPPSRQ